MKREFSVFLYKQAMFSTVKSHESVIEILLSKSKQFLSGSQQSIPGDELMSKYRSLCDRVMVMFWWCNAWSQLSWVWSVGCRHFVVSVHETILMCISANLLLLDAVTWVTKLAQLVISLLQKSQSLLLEIWFLEKLNKVQKTRSVTGTGSCSSSRVTRSLKIVRF